MAKYRSAKNICLSCYGDLDASRVCGNCFKRADDTPSPPHHVQQRTVLNDKYLVGKAIGEGGFGITYTAWDTVAGVKTAIKEYFPTGYVTRIKNNQVIINNKQMQAASNRGLRRFIDEARTLTKLKNLNGVVTVRDFFSANGTAYIVMEFLDGLSLKSYVKRRGGKLPVDETLQILRPVMEALSRVHDLGLIHRDISPDNILITKTNEVKLIDFGAAKYANPDGKTLSVVLKQGFAPEEQYRTHGEQGAWTDIYALAVTVYFCISGRLPPESVQRLVKDTIVPPSKLGAALTARQESGLMKGLAVYAKNRHQTMLKFMDSIYPRPGEARPALTSDRPVTAAPVRLASAGTTTLTSPKTAQTLQRKTLLKPRTPDELKEEARKRMAKRLEESGKLPLPAEDGSVPPQPAEERKAEALKRLKEAGQAPESHRAEQNDVRRAALENLRAAYGLPGHKSGTTVSDNSVTDSEIKTEEKEKLSEIIEESRKLTEDKKAQKRQGIFSRLFKRDK